MIPRLEDADVSGKKVLLRAGLNVPVADGLVVDEFRIDIALPTINYLKEKGAKVLIVAHLGREGESLLPISQRLGKHFPVVFAEDFFSEDTKAKIDGMQNSDVLLFENVRREVGEKENDEVFAKKLADLADLYVNDAFPASHREHASIVGVPLHIPGYAGIRFQEEVKELSKALEPNFPSVMVIGGVKFETKEVLIRESLKRYDHVLIGGALANDFFKARGLEVGTSLVSNHLSVVCEFLHDPKLISPIDVVVQNGEGKKIRAVSEVKEDEAILDVGPKTIELFNEHISDASFVVWNGPMGNFENGFGEQTEGLAKAVAASSAETIIGGGDTLSAIKQLNILDAFSFVSSGGGAMLDFIVDGQLPGIDALINKRSF